MKTTKLLGPIGLSLLGALLLPSSINAAPADSPVPRVAVTFLEPESFTDVRERSFDDPRDRNSILKEFKTFLEDRAPKYLPQGASLSITFTDIDLAGDFEPWRGAVIGDIRIVKDAYPPRMKLSFRLTDANGEVIKQGDRVLTNVNFLIMATPPTNDTYRHEKTLLLDWLQGEFQHDRKG